MVGARGRMRERIKDASAVKRLRKSRWYGRLRQYLPMAEAQYVDDRGAMAEAETVTIDWPAHVPKPRIGIVRDYEPFPRWTKYCRFLHNNGFAYELCNIHAHDWLEHAMRCDAIVGMASSEPYHLSELRAKYAFLETVLGKTCYPSAWHAMLYEDKGLEAYLSQAAGIPFAATWVSHDRADALRLVADLAYPVVSKVVPASASMGVELVHTSRQARSIVQEAFSRHGRKSHLVYARQKGYVYFQEYEINDGYDLRVVVVGKRLFGYYRRVLPGDFRASGMNLVEKRGLPEEAMRIALKTNEAIKSPMLVVDLLHGLDGCYRVVELSPFCQMETPEQLHVDGIPGAYVLGDDGTLRFERGRYWVHELALRQFLLDNYLPSIAASRLPRLLRRQRRGCLKRTTHGQATAEAGITAG